MRKLALGIVALAALTGGFMGCGGSSSRKPNQSGSAGSGGAGSGGAGTGAAGTGVAGTGGAGTGAAGDTGVAGTGVAGTGADAAAGTGAAGTGADAAAGTGAAGQPPPPTYCEAHPAENRALPYNIAQDFKVVHILNNNNAGPSGAWVNVAQADCSDNPKYPAFPTPDAGTDAGSDAGDAGTDADPDASADGGTTSDAGADAAGDAADEVLTLQLDDPDAGDAGVADAAVDAAAEAGTDAVASTDGGTDATAEAGSDAIASADGGDAGAALPACYEFAYNPALCTTGQCWGGVVFQIDDMQPVHSNGICIAPGANTVEWYARASRDGANVKFGFIGEGVGITEKFFNITTAWVKYSMPIDGTNQSIYNTSSDNMNGVWNAFSVVVEPQDHVGGTYIEVKDIRWLKQ